MTKYDVVIVGGSYAGLAAAMGLGRALRKVLLIDGGKPANRFTPHSHNFLTQDGRTPFEISAIAKQQVDQYNTVQRIDGHVVNAKRSGNNYEVTLADGTAVLALKLIFATGIVDMLPDIPGFAECWGKSVLHCPYCHGYELRNTTTGIFGSGDYAFEFAALISNWTSDLTVYTNGPSLLTSEHLSKLRSHTINIVEDEILRLEHNNGVVDQIVFKNGKTTHVRAIYTRPPFKQHSDLPVSLGCGITDDGYIKIDAFQRTTVTGIYACGDNVTRTRTVANAVSMGTTAAITVNKDLIGDTFL